MRKLWGLNTDKGKRQNTYLTTLFVLVTISLTVDVMTGVYSEGALRTLNKKQLQTYS